MTSSAAIRAEADRLVAVFETAGAQRFETDILQPAETLLDLYGEDMRARAYVTQDPLFGEQMLRPDFTVPVVQSHMAQGVTPARYTYAGEVFRRQEDETGRPREYMQVGYEVFDGANPAGADADVFATVTGILAPLQGKLRISMADIGLLLAAVDGLDTSQARKSALKRHIWRPSRFRALLDRFSGKTPAPNSRRHLLQAATATPVAALAATAGPEIGLRSVADIETRVTALAQDAATPPIDSDQVAMIEDLLAIRETPADALERLRNLTVDLPAIEPAVTRIHDRLTALENRGVDLSRVTFDAGYGRTSMEYYDGFVFGISVEGRPDLPPLSTGGRYDALTRVLGRGHGIPAVGAVLRPATMLEAAQ